VREIRRHDLNARDLPAANGIGKRRRIEHHEARRCSRRAKGRRH
jgi:hypothetical protein